MPYTISFPQLQNPEAWSGQRSPYGKNEIAAISDGQGGNTPQPPTSIPSPFARFDLVRTAFLRLNEGMDAARRPNLAGQPNDERLVSACLDVAQLFFHFDKFRDSLELIRWDKKSVDDSLLAEGSAEGHKRLGKALKLFLDQDGGEAKTTNGYNFHQMESLFMLRYTGQGRSLMVGGTSPSTLFFSAPEDLSFIDIKFGNYRLFQPDNPNPLHKRNDPAFQKFLYGFLNPTVHANFEQKFPELHDYLDKSLQLLQQADNALWQQIGNEAIKLTVDAMAKFSQNLEPVNVLGFKMKKEKPDLTRLINSDFVLQSPKFERLHGDKALKPMVLQSEYQGNLQYTRDRWDKKQIVPPYVADDWRTNKRQLPGQPDYYPWLTVSDLLEPYIIRLVYPINQEQFFDIVPDEPNPKQSYLLPLTPTFFELYDVNDLYRTDSPVQLSMVPLGSDSVQFTLAITLKPDEPPVRFQRVYKGLIEVANGKRPPQIPDESQNKGTVVECQVGLNLMPFVRFRAVSPHYNVQIVDRDIDYFTIKHDYRLTFYNQDNRRLDVDAARQRSRKDANNPASTTTTYYSLNQNFDYMVVEIGPGSKQRGVIIPRFDKAFHDDGNDVFTFAVDFGTTNTHIEYMTESQPTPRSLTFGPADAPVATLHDPNPARHEVLTEVSAPALVGVVAREWLPNQVGRPAQASFPTRTALLENQPHWSRNLFAFQDFNPALLYEKQPLPRDIYHVATNLKWADYQQEDEGAKRGEKRVVGYIESLLLLIRNKILLNGGNLSRTRLVWFYPLSMTSQRREFLTKEWDQLFAKHITKNTYPQRIPESTAPYYSFNKNQIAAASYPAVNIDIGGGTSDVVAFENDGQTDRPILISSFRFAANAIFGDAFSESGGADTNGFVKRYGNQINQLLKDNDLIDLVNALEDIQERKRSEDIVAFFFSLKDNQEVQKKVTIDFNEMLAKDNAMKIVFLTFYSAMIYHLARLMQARTLAMPRYIAFSGNGSKVLGVLSTRPAVLATLAKLIFEKVYGTAYHKDGLDIVLNQHEPKEATCKGGLKHSLGTGGDRLDFSRADTGDAEERVEALKSVLLGSRHVSSDGKPRFVTRSDTYNTIDDATLTSVADEVRHFIDLLFRLDEDVSLKDKFGIKTGDLPTYEAILLKNLNQNIKIGFQAKKREAGGAEPVEETLFFYPLVSGLNALATYIAN